MVVRTDACPESSRMHWRTEIARHSLGAGQNTKHKTPLAASLTDKPEKSC